MATRLRRGQAFIELAMGMFVLALVLAALFSFADVIIGSLDTQRDLRSEAGRDALLGSGADGDFASASAKGEVEIEPFAARYLFGSRTVEIGESVHIPKTGIVR